jgi:hypothetical protein
MINWYYDLLSVEAELYGNLLHRVDGSPVHVRLTGLPQAPITNRDAETLEKALERRRAAVHSRGLYDLGHEETAVRPGGLTAHWFSI